MKTKTNFLGETDRILEILELTPNDIVYIGTDPNSDAENVFECSWEEFIKIADLEYDSSYGTQEIRSNLIIVFSNGILLRRGEYEGSEWWETIYPFVKPTNAKRLTSVLQID